MDGQEASDWGWQVLRGVERVLDGGKGWERECQRDLRIHNHPPTRQRYYEAQ